MNTKVDLPANGNEIRTEVIRRLAPSLASSRIGKPTNAEMQTVRRYNLAIHRLVHGKGSSTEEIAILTGLSPKAIERRLYRASKACSGEELNAESGVLSAREREYLSKRYADMNDPAVKSFVQGVCHVERN
ncbi:sigma factor-like helix-turn-helix DNA-binding protein [Singulisphaera sp. Ch08]|uniref:sigma factor-like helix-turn-helix DNA-binding protein n=1 Tax=Singulisphaera sp. Ch08 TaxID=3120278 RepID=UPI0038730717